MLKFATFGAELKARSVDYLIKAVIESFRRNALLERLSKLLALASETYHWLYEKQIIFVFNRRKSSLSCCHSTLKLRRYLYKMTPFEKNFHCYEFFRTHPGSIPQLWGDGYEMSVNRGRGYDETDRYGKIFQGRRERGSMPEQLL